MIATLEDDTIEYWMMGPAADNRPPNLARPKPYIYKEEESDAKNSYQTTPYSNPPPHTHTHTHTLKYTRHWFHGDMGI